MENVCTVTQIRLGEGGGGDTIRGGGVGEPRTGIIYIALSLLPRGMRGFRNPSAARAPAWFVEALEECDQADCFPPDLL